MPRFSVVAKHFMNFAAGKRGWYILFVVILTVQSAIYATLPYFYKIFVDAIPSLNLTLLVKILGFFVIVRIVEMLLSVLAHTLGDVNLIDSAKLARIRVVEKVQQLDFAYHTTKSTGSLISSVKRGDGAYFGIFHDLHFRVYSTLVEFGVMIYFFGKINFYISLIVVVSIVISLIAAKYIVNYNIDKRTNHLKDEDEISGVIVDNFVNFETVKYFAKEKFEISRLEQKFAIWTKSLWGFANSFRVFDITLSLINIVTMAFILLFALYLSVEGQIELGDFVLIGAFMSTVYPRLFAMIWDFRNLAKNYADIQKYFYVFGLEPEIKDPKTPVTLNSVRGEIAFNRVVFSYKEGKKNAINNLSLNIRQGQSVALVGRSGSGKTTLVKLLMRFYDLTAGSIVIDDVNIKAFDKSYLRSLMGIVPQEPVLFNNTIGYNIGYGKSHATKNEIISAAKLANLHNFIMTLPKKYDTNVGERGVKLSGGQKQRLAIARMVLSNPDIVVFDEATSQLDSENEKLIQEAFWQAVKNKTTIIIAHRLSTAMRADKIIVMDNGKIVEEGSHHALLARESLYKYFWNLQINVD